MGNTVHVCSQKELFINSLVAKEDGVVIMVDDSPCEIIGIGTVKATEKDEMVQTLKAVRNVLEA